MNNKKNKSVAIFLTIISAILLFFLGFTKMADENISTKYKVYLDGEVVGLIDDTTDLYDLINSEQSAIKEEYNVDQVYPPKGFEIEKYISYDDNISSVDEIYNKIKDSKNFTIKGYTITVTSKATETEEGKVLFRFNVLNKEIFEESIQNLVNSFITKSKYDAYMNDTQEEIKDTGSIIEDIYFKENISIKEAYISTEDRIFTNTEDLTQFLMFGDDNKTKDYTVKKGDTISSISDANKLNTSEFLIANPKFTSENNMLAVGEKVNVALINPKLSLVYELYVIEDTEVRYETEVKYDSTKSSSYKKVETAGQNGIQRVAKRTKVVNGEENQGVEIDQANTYMIKEVVNEVITKGSKSYNTVSITGTYYDDGSNWAWPTNYPYTLTSPFAWRWGTFHLGQDISGTGYGSPIYAIGDGIVRSSGWGGMIGSASGINIVVEHPNGYWSAYAHLSDTLVKVGDVVKRKQVIGKMGHTGYATGTHLHLGVSIGQPYNGGKWINPMLLWGK